MVSKVYDTWSNEVANGMEWTDFGVCRNVEQRRTNYRMLPFKHALIKCKTHRSSDIHAHTAKLFALARTQLKSKQNKCIIYLNWMEFHMHILHAVSLSLSSSYSGRATTATTITTREQTNEEKPKVQPIDLFSTSFCGYADTDFNFFHRWTATARERIEVAGRESWEAGRKGWQEQTYRKYIFAVGYQLNTLPKSTP